MHSTTTQSKLMLLLMLVVLTANHALGSNDSCYTTCQSNYIQCRNSSADVNECYTWNNQCRAKCAAGKRDLFSNRAHPRLRNLRNWDDIEY